jgi:integrase
MAKVVARRETGKLVIDFTYKGLRCREQTALDDTPRNRKMVQAVVDRLVAAIKGGTFVYAEFFPGSAVAARLNERQTTGSEWVAEVSAPKPAEPIGPTFKVFTDQWLQEHSIEWRRSHIRSLLSTIEGRLYPTFAEKVVSSITKSDVLAFRAALAKEPGRAGKAGLSAKRINEIMGTLKQILEEAADRFEFTSPALNVKRLRVRKTDVQPFSLAEVQIILATVRADYRDYLQVRFLTGMRTGEVNGLKWKYIDFDARLILVRETHVLGEDDYTKTDGSQRDIKMSQPVFEALLRQREITFGRSEYVFCNLLGEPLDNTNFTKRIWYPLLRHLGYELRRPYQMRHTAATLWLASGEAPEFVARQLGHTSTEMLFRTYSRYVPNMTRQDGSAMERLLANQFANGPLVKYEPEEISPAPKRLVPPKTPIQAETVVPRRTSPDLYVPASQTAAMPVPKPRGAVGSKLNRTAQTRKAALADRGDVSGRASGPRDANAQPPPDLGGPRPQWTSRMAMRFAGAGAMCRPSC